MRVRPSAAGPERDVSEPPTPRLHSAARNLLIRALRRHRSTRAFSDRKLSAEMLCGLLWAAYGVHRTRGPFGTVGRTAGAAGISREVDVYVALAEGTYRYDAGQHHLELIVPDDLRAFAVARGQCESDPGVAAPVRLIYVADVEPRAHPSGAHEPDAPRVSDYVDLGLIAVNVYLFAAASGLGAWFHHCDRPRLEARLPLPAGQRVLFAQTVGYVPRFARPRRAQR